MDTQGLLEKLAKADLPVNARLAPVVAKVRSAGLHKAAAAFYEVPTFNLKVGTELLGRKLLHAHLRKTKIAAAIGALPTAANPNIARKSALLNLLKQLRTEGAPIPSHLGGAVNKGTEGMFAAFDSARPAFNPKKTITGNLELPAIRRLPIGG